MIQTYKRGFTLIELLVVIAIIGILASVVLASLNSARAKGADAAIKSNLDNARSQAAIFFEDSGNGYDTVCAVGGGVVPKGVLEFRVAADSAGVATLLATCDDDPSAWAMEKQLSNGTDYYCVDSNGSAKVSAGSKGVGAVVCP